MAERWYDGRPDRGSTDEVGDMVGGAVVSGPRRDVKEGRSEQKIEIKSVSRANSSNG